LAKGEDFTRYDDVPSDYLTKRQLKRSAGWVLLWAMGVGAVISGDFFGWNLGLGVGGFGGLAMATLVMAVMYFCMVFSVAELTAALPHAGGFFSFTRNAFGPAGGFICGLTDTIEYILTPAVIVVGIGGYLNALVFGSSAAAPPGMTLIWWGLAYGLFVAINVRGVELTLKVGLVVTVMATLALVLFYASVIARREFNTDLLLNIPPASPQGSNWLPFGWKGVFAALPYAIWFFLAIEQLPLAAEESHDVARDIPKALVWGIVTLLVLAILTLVFNSSVGGGARELARSEAPLADGFRAVFGSGVATRFLTLISLTGLVASFHTVIYAYGRVLFALSRAGYIPRWISLTSRYHTPHVALILGALVGFACAALIEFTKSAGGQSSIVGAMLLNMAVFGAVISYILVLASFIQLRIRRPHLPRPYRSPLGVPGAVVGLVLAVVSLAATFTTREYRPAIAGTAIFLGLGLLYFLGYSRYRLVARAPEEENAVISEAERELAELPVIPK
jgi:ethanolamine permease